MFARLGPAISSALLSLALSACVATTSTPSVDPIPVFDVALEREQLRPSVTRVVAPPPQAVEHRFVGVRTPERYLEVWKKPGGSRPWKRVDMVNVIGQRITLVATRSIRDETGTEWLRVLVPERPNGSSGWVRSSDVAIVRLRHKIVVDLSSYTLKHFKNNKLVHEFTVGIGQDQWPTPTGTYYIWAGQPQPDPSGAYGLHIFALSGFSPVLFDWPGGGRAGIHGTPDPSDLGRKVSHGCVRVFNPDMQKLTVAPLGTPVVIRQ